MHLVLLDLDMYAQSYGYLKLNGSVECVERFEMQ